MKPKYHSRKIEKDGIKFDSVREYKRWNELKLLERAGEITKLKRQVKYDLLPSQHETYIDPKSGKTKRRCIERGVSYVADFTYWHDGQFVVEDTKGFRTKDYIIKRKLMLYVYGIQVKEI